MNNLIAQALSSVTLGPPVTFENITMVPLLVADPPRGGEPAYLTLDEALALGWTEVTEVSEGGSVPHLRVVNKGDKPVFILDGEELVGARQNRVVNLSILVPAAASLTIPVSCVEAGRWRARSRAFTAAPRTQYAAGRAKRMQQVTMSMMASEGRFSDQAEVWADIAEKSARMDVHSDTGAMEEIFTRTADFTDRAVAALNAADSQVGALFLVAGRVVGFDLFDSVTTFRRLLPKLVRSVAADAIERADEPTIQPDLSVKVAEHFLAAVRAAPTHEEPAVGTGTDVRIASPVISGAALANGPTVLHLCAFHL